MGMEEAETFSNETNERKDADLMNNYYDGKTHMMDCFPTVFIST